MPPRCPFADQLCLATDPALTAVPHGGRAACHHPQSGPAGQLAAATVDVVDVVGAAAPTAGEATEAVDRA